MKALSKIFLLFILVILMNPTTAWSAEKPFGLGVILGGPSGVSVNYKLSRHNSVDAALGAGLGDRDLHLHATYLIHYPATIHLDTYDFGWYLGGGGRFANRDVRKKNGRDENQILLGPRGSVGLNFPIQGSSLRAEGYEFDVFAEFALTLNVIEDVDLDGDLAVGARVYF